MIGKNFAVFIPKALINQEGIEHGEIIEINIIKGDIVIHRTGEKTEIVKKEIKTNPRHLDGTNVLPSEIIEENLKEVKILKSGWGD